MSLESALSTALTGMGAAETSITVVGNNLSNADTVGFKASTATFATQFLQTQTLGSAPSASNGGTDPAQIGLGTLVSAITPDFSQGTISDSSTASNMAIQGNGMFMVQGAGGQQLYTRDGEFQMNSQNQLVNSSGNLLLGYGVDDQFNINSSTVTPLSIPLGTATVAQATQNVVLQGSLPSLSSGTTTIANQASILQTGVLADAQYSAPTTAPSVPSQSIVAGDIPVGTYQYYVTFSNGTQVSRPSPISNAITLTSPSQITVDLPSDTTGQWQDMEVYRCTSTDPNTFYQVDDIVGGAGTAGQTFVDNLTDAQVKTGATLTNMNGPPITTATLLTNLLSQDATTGNFDSVFPSTGTLNFTGTLNSASLATKTFTVTNTSTVGEYLTFMQQALGIQTSPGPDAANPIPPDATSGLYPGGYVTNSQLELVGNNGSANAIGAADGSMTLTTNGNPPQTSVVSLPFTATQTAAGTSCSTDFVAYDSLGTPLQVTVTAVLQASTSSATVYRWFADCKDNDPASGSDIAVGTGLVSFDAHGNLITATNSTVSIDRAHEPSVNPLQFNLNFDSVSGLQTGSASLQESSQDGSAPGTLSSYQIGDNGTISGVFSNGVTRNLGQITLATFANPDGLQQQGQNMYTTGVNSGLPVVGAPGTNGAGTIVGGAVELSNADVGTNLIDLITDSTMYEANSKVITTTQQLFQDLLSLQR